jgi:SAM-dependent methyltransferase
MLGRSACAFNYSFTNMSHLNSQHSGIGRKESRDLGYSLRRHYVDEFHFREVPLLPSGARVLDLGGTRIAKRGRFNIERFGLEVTVANLSRAKSPHVQAEAGLVPFRDGTFDAVVCSELLEHVPDPSQVLAEIYRVLQPGGTVLICVPFLNRIHGDPYDYGRYSDYYWGQTLERIGFGDIRIEKQGQYWSVLMDMLRDLVYLKTGSGWMQRDWIVRLAGIALGVARRKALEWDRYAGLGSGSAPTGFTTGFGIRAKKV